MTRDSVNQLVLAYAANRRIGVRCLELLLARGLSPKILLVPPLEESETAREIVTMVPGTPVLQGREFRGQSGISVLSSLSLDFMISIHFPYVFPREVLAIPRQGTLNLHPAYLPFNRGWHTATWAILDKTQFGVTLHWVDEGLDTGDIALQESLAIEPDDTADSLYRKALDLEVVVFEKAIPMLMSGTLPRIPQGKHSTFHRRRDIEGVRDLTKQGAVAPAELVRVLRALTTNVATEAAYLREDGKKLLLRLDIKADLEDG